MRPISALPLALCAGLLSTHCIAAGQVVCHLAYGGETVRIAVAPTRTPYAQAPVSIGSFFLFRAVLDDRPGRFGGLKLYTYADRDEAAVPIHIAEFPLPLSNRARFGFTGMQRVYEPVRDGELEYWCETHLKGSVR